jgi:predicted glycosyltransferase
MYKVLIYSHDTFGMGHISRSIKLSKEIIAKKKASIIIVTGSAIPNLIDIPKGIEMIKLPTLRSIRKKGLSYESFNANIDPLLILKMRELILLDIIKSYKPDLMLVDFSPKGVKNELESSLKYIKKNLKTKMFITFRDIIDDPRVVTEKWKRRGYEKLFKQYYDKILIFGQKEINDYVKQYQLNDDTKNKIVYLGYMVKRVKIGNKKKDKILITVGGGRDGKEILIKLLKSIKKIKKFRSFKIDVVSGPLSNKKDFIILKKQYAKYKNIKILFCVPNLSEKFSKYKLVISMGGYNTFTDVLSSEISNLIIPREDFEKEQLIRAKIFKKIGLVNYLRRGNINKKNLEREIINAFNMHKEYKHNISKIDINGLLNFKKII